MHNFLRDINIEQHRQNNLKLIFGLGTVVYVAFGMLLHVSDIQYNDPPWLRVFIVFIGILSLILSVYSESVKKNLVKVLFGNLYIYNAHLYYLLIINDFDANYKLSLLVIIFASILFIEDRKLNRIYLAVNAITYSFLLIATGHFEIENMGLAFLIFMALLIGYLTNNERINAFDQIKERETLLKSINNNVYHGIFRMNLNDEIIYANNNFAIMLGYNSVLEIENVAKPIKFTNKEKARVLNLLRLKHQTVKNEEVEIKKRDGQSIWVLLSLTPFEDTSGKILFYDGAIIDITDRKKAEKDLMLFSAAIDHSTTSVVITDRGGTVKYVNPFFTQVSGYSFDEVYGKKIKDFLTEPKGHNMWRDLRDGKIWKGELSHVNKSGKHITELTSVAPIRNAKDEIISYVIVSEDITDRKQAEKELLIAKEQAEAANRAQEQFLSTISHELRTPMNAVIGITNLLLEENPKASQTENLNILKFSANNLLALINDILDLSKIEAGKLDILPEDFDLSQVIGGIKKAHSLRTSQKDVDLIVNIHDKVPKVLIGDVMRLHQILNNLIGNAVKFTDKGSITVDVDLKSFQDDQIDLEFTVTDTGIGIPQDKLNHIFESFSQASALTNRVYGGTGLGLAITKRLIELQDGKINVTSEIDKGSSFRFNLKFKKSNKLSLPTETPIPKSYSGLSGLSILLVEDNKVNQKVAAKFLNKWEAYVDFADNGLEAIEKLKQHHYDIILMDLLMPVMDGYTATREIRKMAEFKHIPIVALTASALNHERENAFEAGVDDYVCKPFVPSELYNKITKFTYQLTGQVKTG